jgi:CheY-like chemotaxis protein
MAINRKLLSALAQKLGFTTREAGNGAEALQLLAQHVQQRQCDSSTPSSSESSSTSSSSSCDDDLEYACILMDLQMPVLDGWSTALQLRQLGSHLSSLPIIACTACDLAAAGTAEGRLLEQRTLACGIDMCLNKPLRLDQLTAALQQLSVACPATISGSQQQQSQQLPQEQV